MIIVECAPDGVPLRAWAAESYELVGHFLHMRNVSILRIDVDEFQRLGPMLRTGRDGRMHSAVVYPMTEYRYITVDLEPGESGPRAPGSG